MTTTRKHPHEHPEHHSSAPRDREPAAEQADPTTSERDAKISELESALAEARDRHLRLAADFDNYKKRTRQEQVDLIQHASTELIKRLLPVLDDLRNVIEHRPKGIDEAWSKGIEMSVRKLEEAMSAHGLEPIDSVGTTFDPKYHEAIGHEESDEHPEDTVVSELRRGYRIRDRVVRPSLVKVSRRPELGSPGQANNPNP